MLLLDQSPRWVLAALVALAVAGCGGTAGGDSLAAGDGAGQPAAGPQATPAGRADPLAGVDAEAGGSSASAAGQDATRPAAGAGPSDRSSFPEGVAPEGLEIPAIGVDATVVELDLRGPEPEVPSDFAETGWYEQTRRPGQIGPAVIAGHIDSVDGPAVFARLDELEAGDEVVVHGTGSGGSATFVVTGAGQYPKEALPDEVFGFGGPVPELRLITCGGTFDRSSGHYQDNYVVYAELAVAPS